MAGFTIVENYSGSKLLTQRWLDAEQLQAEAGISSTKGSLDIRWFYAFLNLQNQT